MMQKVTKPNKDYEINPNWVRNYPKNNFIERYCPSLTQFAKFFRLSESAFGQVGVLDETSGALRG